MAEDTTDGLVYLFEIESEHKDFLVLIRHWNHLKIARDQNTYWVKKFSEKEINSNTIKSIPFKHCYSLRERKLYPLGSKLPLKKMAQNLIWTPIIQGVPVTLPKQNFNLFEINDKCNFQLKRIEEEKEVMAMITPITTLEKYIHSAASIRLAALKWSILNDDYAIILGQPLLPIQGESYWLNGKHLLPSGYNFEFDILRNEANKLIGLEENILVLWNKDSTYSPLLNSNFKLLSIASFRKSVKAI